MAVCLTHGLLCRGRRQPAARRDLLIRGRNLVSDQEAWSSVLEGFQGRHDPVSSADHPLACIKRFRCSYPACQW